VESIYGCYRKLRISHLERAELGMLRVVILATAPLVSARAMPDCDVLDRTKTGKNWAMLAERDCSRAEYCAHLRFVQVSRDGVNGGDPAPHVSAHMVILNQRRQELAFHNNSHWSSPPFMTLCRNVRSICQFLPVT